MADEDAPRGSGLRMLHVLRSVARAPAEFSLKEIAEDTDLPPSTVHRLLAVLVEADFAERTGTTHYRAGARLFTIASQLLRKFDLPRIARPYLLELWEEWHETTVLSVYRPGSASAVAAEIIPTTVHHVRVHLEPFGEVPLAWGSIGRTILAQLPEDEMDAIIARSGPAPLNARPLPPPGELKKELRKIREAKVAVFIDADAGIAGVSSPVFGPQGQVIGCIGILLPDARIGDNSDAMIEGVRTAGERLSHRMGFDRPAELERITREA